MTFNAILKNGFPPRLMVVVIILALVFPPYLNYVGPNTLYHFGYGFIFNLPEFDNGSDAFVYIEMVLLEIFVLVLSSYFYGLHIITKNNKLKDEFEKIIDEELKPRRVHISPSQIEDN